MSNLLPLSKVTRFVDMPHPDEKDMRIVGVVVPASAQLGDCYSRMDSLRRALAAAAPPPDRNDLLGGQAPQTPAEPVAEVTYSVTDGLAVRWLRIPKPGDKLYASPQAALAKPAHDSEARADERIGDERNGRNESLEAVPPAAPQPATAKDSGAASLTSNDAPSSLSGETLVAEPKDCKRCGGTGRFVKAQDCGCCSIWADCPECTEIP